MRIFISHSNKDKELADALVTLLQIALRLGDEDIRCTSLPGFGLKTGSNILEALQKDVQRASIAIGLLTPSSLESIWVIFELGARWGLGQDILPLCADGMKPQDLPDPLKSLAAVDCCDEQQLQRFVEDIAETLRQDLGRTSAYSRLINELAKIASVQKQLKNHTKSTQEENLGISDTQGESSGSSTSSSPMLVLEWADPDSGEGKTSLFSMTSLILERPEEPIKQEPTRTPFGTIADPLENTNYLQEVVDYVADQAFYTYVSLRIKNEGDTLARGVRFVGEIERAEGLSIRDEIGSIPEEHFIAKSPFLRNELGETEEAKVTLRPYEDRWEVIVDFEKIRPHDERTSFPLWFGSKHPRTVRIRGELRGDDVKNPIKCILEVAIRTEQRLMYLEDVKPFLDSE